jgi:hypothetical protein
VLIVVNGILSTQAEDLRPSMSNAMIGGKKIDIYWLVNSVSKPIARPKTCQQRAYLGVTRHWQCRHCNWKSQAIFWEGVGGSLHDTLSGRGLRNLMHETAKGRAPPRRRLLRNALPQVRMELRKLLTPEASKIFHG